MKIAALLALVVVGDAAARGTAHTGDAFVLLANGQIVKLIVPQGRLVVRRSLGRTPRRIPDHGKMLAVDGARIYALVPTRPQTLVVTNLELRVESAGRYRATCSTAESFARRAGRTRSATVKVQPSTTPARTARTRL